jgi:hypothetical protein
VEFDFEMGDLLAQSRLCNVQLRAGLGEASVVDDPDQIAKLTQFQRRSSQASSTPRRSAAPRERNAISGFGAFRLNLTTGGPPGCLESFERTCGPATPETQERR